MKALVYRGPGVIDHAEVPEPATPGPDDAVVQVTLAGICGSDLHIYHGHGFSEETGFSVGHEAVGIVRETGARVRIPVGTRVLIPASIGCGSCPACRMGRISLCTNPSASWSDRVYGIGPLRPGLQAEYVTVPHADGNLVPITDEIGDEAAVVLTDNAPTAWYGCRRARVSPGETVVVIGLGPVGLLAVQSALLLGAGSVFGVDPVASRRKRAEAFGA